MGQDRKADKRRLALARQRFNAERRQHIKDVLAGINEPKAEPAVVSDSVVLRRRSWLQRLADWVLRNDQGVQ